MGSNQAFYGKSFFYYYEDKWENLIKFKKFSICLGSLVT